MKGPLRWNGPMERTRATSTGKIYVVDSAPGCVVRGLPRHGFCDRHRIRAEIFLVHVAVPIHHEGHHAGRAILSRIRDERKRSSCSRGGHLLAAIDTSKVVAV